MIVTVINANKAIAKKCLIKMLRATKLAKRTLTQSLLYHTNLAVEPLTFKERLGHPPYDFLSKH